MKKFAFVLFAIAVASLVSAADSWDTFLNHLRSDSDYKGFVYPTFEATVALRKATTQFADACPDDAVIYRSRDQKSNVIARVFDPTKPVEQGCIELRLTESAGGKMPLIEMASFQVLDARIGLAKYFVEVAQAGGDPTAIVKGPDHPAWAEYLTERLEFLKDRGRLHGNSEGIENFEAYELTKRGVMVKMTSRDAKGPRPGMSFGLDLKISKVDGKFRITRLDVVN